jgi:hypothetical protein
MNDLYYRYLRSDRSQIMSAHKAAEALVAEVEHRLASDLIFSKLSQIMVPTDNWSSVFKLPSPTPIQSSECVNAAHDAVAQYCGMPFHSTVIPYHAYLATIIIIHLITITTSLCVDDVAFS